jgi:hypothetical protein
LPVLGGPLVRGHLDLDSHGLAFPVLLPPR